MLAISQETLGQKVGVTFQQIQKYEKGANRVGASRLSQIAAALNVEVSYFFEGQQAGTIQAVPGSDRDFSGVREFLSTREGVDLITAFVAIGNPQVRHHIIKLTQALARSDRPEASDPAAGTATSNYPAADS